MPEAVDMGKVTEAAYAKINLFLGITRKRPDGFHDISTVMQTVSLADTVSVSVKESLLPEIKIQISSAIPIPNDRTNLAYRAAEAYMAESGVSLSVEIELIKRIPTQAGLGGGSADAAAVLRALDRLSPHPVGLEGLLAIGATLGADVPFCILGGTALCEGKGERLTPICCKEPLYAVIVKGDESVSTPDAYRSLDRLYSDFDGSARLPSQSAVPMASALAAGGFSPTVMTGCYNIFEDAVFSSCPRALRQRDALRSLGAIASCLSGSGSAVFGIFPSAKEAEEAALKIGNGAVAAKSTLSYF